MGGAGTGSVRPTGTVTFLFTDVEGSTRLWAADGEAMSASLRVHEAILREVIASHGGYVFTTAGDSFAAAFARASDAVSAAVRAQADLAEVVWPGPVLRVRMGLHLGDAEERNGDYFGPVVNTAARVEAAGHGGQVLITEAVRLASSVPGGDTTDLGVKALRDVAEPIRLFQLGSGTFPPLRVVDPALSNLPVRPTRLVGRDEELTHLGEMLTRSRLVTITAVGGSGKTRLAIALGEAELVHRPGGVWFVDLSTVMADADVPSAIRAELGLSMESSDVGGQVISFLRDKSALIILDNCEHVVQGCAEFADRFLSVNGASALLATSREALDVEGERVLTLHSLPSDSAHSAGVRLFMDRATAVNSDFTLTNANAPVVAEICQRLDGLPLAIELAAARVTVMTAVELLAGLDDRFGLLSGGRRRTRQRTLEATLDWSYDLLEPDQQQLFRSLGVFVGGFDIDAVASVSGAARTSARDHLDALVAKSLVVRADQSVGARFRLLETVKAYAEDRLVDVGDAAAVRDRHMDHFHSLALEKGRTLGQSMALTSRLAGDLGNIINAFDWAANTNRWTLAAELLTCSSTAFTIEHRFAELRELTTRAKDHADALDTELAGCVTAVASETALALKDWRGFRSNAEQLTSSPIVDFRAIGFASLAWMSIYFDTEAAPGLLSQAEAELARADESGHRDIHRLATNWVGQARAVWLLNKRRYRECVAFGLDWLARHGDGDGWQIGQVTAASRAAPWCVLVTAMSQIMLGRPSEALQTLSYCKSRQVGGFVGGIDVGAFAHLELGDIDVAQDLIRTHATQAAMGQVRSVPGDAVLLLAALAHAENDNERARTLLLNMGQSRHDSTAAYGVHLARQLGILTEYLQSLDRATAPDPEYGMLGERRALLALREELARRRWT